MIQELTLRTAGMAAKNALAHINNERIRVSRARIQSAQNRGQWPEKYLSYNGPIRKRNEFADPNIFFGLMKAYGEKQPQRIRARWTFLPIVDQSDETMREAVRYAWEMIGQQTRKFAEPSGYYVRNLSVFTNGPRGRREYASPGALPETEKGTRYEITNIVAYASTLEVSIKGGILYFAAKKVKAKYPMLGVSFTYAKAAEFGVVHVPRPYDLPMLTIGRRGDVLDRLRTPGRRTREGRTAARRNRGN